MYELSKSYFQLCLESIQNLSLDQEEKTISSTIHYYLFFLDLKLMSPVISEENFNSQFASLVRRFGPPNFKQQVDFLLSFFQPTLYQINLFFVL